MDAQVLDQLEVVAAGADPGGDLGEAVAQFLAAAHGLPVLLAVYKEFRLADDPVRAAQPGHQLVQVHDLVHGIGLHGLLTVPEGSVCDPNLFRHAHRHAPVVEGDARHLVKRRYVTVEVRFRDVLQIVLIAAFFQQIGLRR